MTEFAELVKQTRELRGLRAYDVAYALGMAPSWLSKLESGSMANPPTPVILAKLHEELGISERQMLRAIGYLSTEEDQLTESFDALDPIDQQLLMLAARLSDEQKSTLISLAEVLARNGSIRQKSEPKRENTMSFPSDRSVEKTRKAG